VEIFNSSTVGGGSSMGIVSVDPNGNWTLSSTGVGPQPNSQLQISVESASNPSVKLEGITLVVR